MKLVFMTLSKTSAGGTQYNIHTIIDINSKES